jgi:metal-responsive CopG/Arc/MetJ family transcriptional regulator
VKKKKMIAKGLTSKSRAATVRATISFPHKLHTTLEKIAKQKKVSLAWIVRDAAEQYLAAKRPRLSKQA